VHGSDLLLPFTGRFVVPIDVFSQHFTDLKDPRQTAKISYSLLDVLFLTLCAIIYGAEGFTLAGEIQKQVAVV